MDLLRIGSTGLGTVVVVVDFADVVRALVVRRPYVGGPVATVLRPLRRTYLALGQGQRRRGEALLAVGEPALLFVRLALWLAVGVAGFALIVWGTSHEPLASAVVQSGSSVFTLGFATRPGTVPAVVAFLAAAFGLVVVALQIAYLPTLYDAYNRRETLVTLLESRAGTPPWGPELLARHQLVGIQHNLPALYADWERWAADVAESHTTYPALLWLRSPHAGNSWIGALTAVLDSGALLLALCPDTAPPEARICVRMGFTCLRDVARVLRMPFDPDPSPEGPLRLRYEEFVAAVAHLQAAGLRCERTAADAWPHFRGWRVNYESIADRLADILVAPRAPWLGTSPIPAPHPRRPVDRRPSDHRASDDRASDDRASDGKPEDRGLTEPGRSVDETPSDPGRPSETPGQRAQRLWPEK